MNTELSLSSTTKVAGCKNNGTCSTSGCNKLNVYNWLSDISLPAGQQPFNIVEVRFKGTRKEFYKNKDNFDLHTGDLVAVEGAPGHDIGEVSMLGELVRLQMKKKHVAEDSSDIKIIYRLAKNNDIERWRTVKNLEDKTLHRTREIIRQMQLGMKLIF